MIQVLPGHAKLDDAALYARVARWLNIMTKASVRPIPCASDFGSLNSTWETTA